MTGHFRVGNLSRRTSGFRRLCRLSSLVIRHSPNSAGVFKPKADYKSQGSEGSFSGLVLAAVRSKASPAGKLFVVADGRSSDRLPLPHQRGTVPAMSSVRVRLRIERHIRENAQDLPRAERGFSLTMGGKRPVKIAAPSHRAAGLPGCRLTNL
jgi:hypothetical protein